MCELLRGSGLLAGLKPRQSLKLPFFVKATTEQRKKVFCTIFGTVNERERRSKKTKGVARGYKGGEGGEEERRDEESGGAQGMQREREKGEREEDKRIEK